LEGEESGEGVEGLGPLQFQKVNALCGPPQQTKSAQVRFLTENRGTSSYDGRPEPQGEAEVERKLQRSRRDGPCIRC